MRKMKKSGTATFKNSSTFCIPTCYFALYRMSKATVDSELESFVAANLKLYQMHE